MSGDETTEVIRDAEGRITGIRKPDRTSEILAGIQRLAESSERMVAAAMAVSAERRPGSDGGSQARLEAELREARERELDALGELADLDVLAEAVARKMFEAGVAAGASAVLGKLAPPGASADIQLREADADQALECIMQELAEAFKRAQDSERPALPPGPLLGL
jgi:hypothetical protein